MNRIVRIAFFIPFIVLAACAQATPINEAVKDAVPPTITVVGKGTLEVTADAMFVEFFVLSCGSDLSTAIAENNTNMEKALAYLRGTGISDGDINTTAYAVSKIRDSYGECLLETPFVVKNAIAVTIRNLHNAGAILGGAMENGINNVDRMYFFVQDPSESIIQARKLAVADARGRAEELVKELNRKLGDPIKVLEGDVPVSLIREVNVNLGRWPIYGAYGGGGDGGSTIPLVAGSVSVVVNVNITYILK
jgi:uncharacterized protein YggE